MEAILWWAQYTITGDKRVQSALNYFFKTFGESWKYEYWPIIVRGYRCNLCIFRILGNSPFAIHLKKIQITMRINYWQKFLKTLLGCRRSQMLFCILAMQLFV